MLTQQTSRWMRRRGERLVRIITAIAVVLSTFLPMMPAHAARLTTLSLELDSTKPSATVNFTMKFTTATQISGDTTASDDDGSIIIRFPNTGTDPFTLGGTPASSDVSLTGCNAAGGVTARTPTYSDGDSDGTNDTITFPLNQTSGSSAVNISASTSCTLSYLNRRVTLPTKVAAAGTSDLYDISFASRDNGGSSDLDTGATRITVLDAISVSATVNTTLSLVVAATTATTYGSDTIESGATAVTIPLGTLAPNTAEVRGHRLTIATNAPNGYDLYILQSQNLSSGSDDIDQFKDGSRVDDGADTAWTAPAVSAQNEATHGHLGYGSSDTGVFTAGQYAGIPTRNAATAAPDTTGLTCDNTVATTSDTCDVVYKVEISALQPAGTYTSETYYIIVAKY